MNDAVETTTTEVSQTSSETPAAPESLLGKDLPTTEVAAEASAEVAEVKPEEAQEPFSFDKVTLPEDLTIPNEVKTELTELATKHGLKPEAASELLALHAKISKESTAAAYAAWQETQTKWVGEIKSDPEFTGEKLQQAQATIARALDEFGDKEVRAAFDLTGAGSNPAIFRTFYKMAKALSEGTSATGASPAGAGPQSLADIIYSKG